MPFVKIGFVFIILLMISSIVQAQEIRISGKITDNKDNPLSETTVKINKSEVKTDHSGAYNLIVPTTGKYEIIIHRLGFKSINQTIDINSQNQVFDFKLFPMDYHIEEVLISTQKRVQNKVDVPITIDVLGGEKLNRLNLQELNELSAFTPGVQLAIQSVNNPAFVIRGITSDDLDPRSQPRVSLSMDAVPISRPALAVSELFDMERIEVAKGPQGTLLGRSAQIGAINMIRKKPIKDQQLDFKGQYGNYNRRLINAMYNSGSEDSRFANRFSLAYHAQDGFVKNLSGGTLNGKNTLAFRNSSRYFLKNDGTVDLILSYQHDDAPGTSFKNGVWKPKNGDLKPSTFADLDKGKELGIKRDVYSATLLLDQRLSESWTLSTVTGFNKYDAKENFDIDGTAAHVINGMDHSFGKQFSQELRLNYNRGNRFNGFIGLNYFYEDSKETVGLDVNEQNLFPAFASSLFNAQFKKQLTGAFKNMGDGASSFAQYTGVVNNLVDKIFPLSPPLLLNGVPQPYRTMPNIYEMLSYELNSMNFMAVLPAEYQALLKQLVPSGELTADVLKNLVNRFAAEQAEQLNAISGAALSPSHYESYSLLGRTNSFDVFLDGTYDLTEKLQLTAGIRGTFERLTGGYLAPESKDPSIIAQMQNKNNNLLAPVANDWITESKNYFSYVGRLAMNYKFHSQHNIYATVSKGRRPPVIYIWPGANKNLKAEIVWNYELGIKGIYNNKLSYAFAGYYYDWSNFQTTRLVQVEGTVGVQPVAEDAGKARSYGFEGTLEYQLLKSLNVFSNYAYVDARFNEKDSQGNQQVFAGNTFRMVPKHSITIGFNATHELSPTKQIFLRPNYNFKSKVYFEDENREVLSQEGFGIMNATLGFKFKKSNKRSFEIGVFGKNILDQKYVMDAGNSGDNIDLPTFVAGPRAIYGASFGLNL
ncbi:TonB-dependent receptor [Sphingobacterium cellulitidis]|uniref:TonB-dependent receptor n=1 Tax=Sphingobacterium cellulitidis TaxID=1768011 RepID=UPI00370DA198